MGKIKHFLLNYFWDGEDDFKEYVKWLRNK